MSPRFVKPGQPPVESSAPRDRVNLLAQGYKEEKDGAFDPSKHRVEDVVAHIEAADPEERNRVLAAEQDGKGRKSVLDAAPTE